MPVAVVDTPLVAPPLAPPRKRWTRDELNAISGLLGSQRLELIEGELLSKMSKKRPHSNAVSLLLEALVRIFGFPYVQQEVSIDVAPEDTPTSEPEPDLIVLARPLSAFPEANPQPADLRLVAEVSDTTLAFDCSVKASLYARAGIADYWVIDVTGRRILVHREPRDGRYTAVAAYSLDESVAPLAASADSIRVADILSI